MVDAKVNLVREFEIALNMSDNPNPVNTLIGLLMNYDVGIKTTNVQNYDDINERSLKRFVATKRIENKSEKTIERYSREVNKLLSGINLPVNEISTDHIRYYLGIRLECGVSPNTVEGNRKIYSTFFTWLHNEGIITINPCASLNAIKVPKIQKKAFSTTDLEKIRMSCDTLRDLALVDFLRSTGCRVGEVVTVKLADINWFEKSLNVIGKGNKERTVYLDDVSILNLTNYIESRSDNNPYLFIGKGNKELHENGVRTILNRIGEKAEVENVHPHRFRRTLATNLLNHGMRIEEVAEILGHEDITTTRGYCEVTQINVKNSYNRYIA